MSEYGRNVYFIEFCKTCKTVVDGRKYNEETQECQDCHSAKYPTWLEQDRCLCAQCRSRLLQAPVPN